MRVQANVPCCVCGETGSDLLFETEYPQYGYPGTFSMRKCTTCGLLFSSPRLMDEELSALYREGYYFFQRSDDAELTRATQVYERTVSSVEHQTGVGPALAIGSGKGYLLAVMRELGWEVQGVEIASCAAEYARTVFGVPTFEGTIEDYSRRPDVRRFPLVLAIDVIEHVPYPPRFISSVSRLVDDGGLLVVDTPNGGSSDIALAGARWRGFNPYHIFLFPARGISSLLSANAFEIERLFSYQGQPCAPPRENRVRSVARGIARGLRVLGLLRRLRDTARRLSVARAGSADSHLQRAIARLGRGAPPEKEGRTGGLAEDDKGDNLVVIARRQPRCMCDGDSR